MNQNLLIKTPLDAQNRCLPEQSDTAAEAQDTAGLEYHPVKAAQTLRVKARVRSIVAGKPLRYEFPTEG